MAECPHCGTALPAEVDAFCPECREPLDESPLRYAATGAEAPGSEKPSRNALGALVAFGGTAAMLLGAFSLTRGDWPEAIYTGGFGVAMIIAGLVWAGKAAGAAGQGGASGPPQRQPRSIRLPLLLAGCAVAVGLLAAAVQLWRGRPPATQADIAGTAEPGDYRNPYFGFRVQYKGDWKDVTAGARGQAAERLSGGVASSSILLALSRSPEVDQDEEAGVMFLAEPLPASGGATSGAEYLRRMMPRLQQRRDPPREVTEGPQATIAGLRYDRVSFRRRWGEGEVRMTYWVAVIRGHAVLISGTYSSPEGLRAIEALLAGVSAHPGD